jgi:hypothetical protein
MKRRLHRLPLRAAYSLTELSRACAMDRRTIRRLLARAGVTFLDSGRVVYVPISVVGADAFVRAEGNTVMLQE